MFEGSGLTVASQRGAEYVGADTPGERISAVVAGQRRQPASLTYVYEGELDATGHRKGCHSWAWEHQLGDGRRVRCAAPRGPAATRCALVVTADHGMVDIAAERRVDVDASTRRCSTASTLLGGEARFRHLYCAAGRRRRRRRAVALGLLGATRAGGDAGRGDRGGLVRRGRLRTSGRGSAT